MKFRLNFTASGLAVGVILYFLFVDSKGTHNTIYFQEWIAGLVHGNFFSLYHVVPGEGGFQNSNLTVPYPPFSLYLLGGTAKLLIVLFGEGKETFIVASNLTSVVFTLLTATILLWSYKKTNSYHPKYYLLTPAVFLLSPILGYQDTIMSFFILGSFLALEKNFMTLSGIFAALAIFSKQLAVMPIFGLVVLLIISRIRIQLLNFLVSFAVTSFAVLSPFIVTNTLKTYFYNQGLASVHTMMSAQNPNIPWLIAFMKRISMYGFFSEESYSASPYQIANQVLRQRIYLSFGAITIAVIITYVTYWAIKIGRRNISSLHVGVVSICAYNLFSFGVHENHVFMVIPLLFAITYSPELKKIYWITSTALGLNLLATGGLGFSFPYIPILAINQPIIYSGIGVLCLISYSWAFYRLLHIKPIKVTV